MVDAEEAFNEKELKKFANDKSRQAERDVVSRRQIRDHRLYRFQNDERQSKKREGRIGRQRNDPFCQALGDPMLRNPICDRIDDSPKDRAHQDVDGNKNKDDESQQALHANTPTTKIDFLR